MQTKTNLKIDWATHEAAKYACENWHYSKCLPAGKLVKIGVWENSNFIGVVIFSGGPTPNMWKTFDLSPIEGSELSRVALTKHITPVSKILAISIKFFKNKCPKIKLLISYADKKMKHHGGVYQASNWIYLGSFGQNMFEVIRKSDRKKIHMRNAREEIARGRAKKTDFIWQKSEEKHKYALPLDEEMKKRILPLSKPYPKRAGSIVADAPEVHSGEGGSVPTPALHSQEAQNGTA
jgi:hypothetical protein